MLKTVGFSSTRTGDQTIVDGNLVIGTAGKGIDFSATSQSGGMTSELLNDYEEGTWTPADASGAGLTFSAAIGKYTKVGRIVTAYFSVTYPSTANTAQARISLPFDSSHGAFNLSYTNGSLAFWGYPEGGSSRVAMVTNSGAAVTNANLSGIRVDGNVVLQV